MSFEPQARWATPTFPFFFPRSPKTFFRTRRHGPAREKKTHKTQKDAEDAELLLLLLLLESARSKTDQQRNAEKFVFLQATAAPLCKRWRRPRRASGRAQAAPRRGDAAAVWPPSLLLILLLFLLLLLLIVMVLARNGGARPRSAGASRQRGRAAIVAAAAATNTAAAAAVVKGKNRRAHLALLLARSHAALCFFFSSDAVAAGDGLERGQAEPCRDHRRGRALEARVAPVAGVERAGHERARAGADAGVGLREERLRRRLHPRRGEARDVLCPCGPGAWWWCFCVSACVHVCKCEHDVKERGESE